MNPMVRNYPGGDSDAIRRCRKLRDQLLAGRISFSEYADAITLEIVCAEDPEVMLCVALVPPQYLTQYAMFLQSYLEPVDFMPSPVPFLVGNASGEVAEQIQLRLRPKYQQLYQIVRGAAASGRPSTKR